MSIYPVDWPQSEAPDSEGWLLDEDKALRLQLMGMFATDQTDRTRPIKAWYSNPDGEIVDQTYPYVTIDLLNIEEATERVSRGTLYMDRNNLPPRWFGYGPLPAGAAGWATEMTTPINLNYQITTWARNPRHDRQMLAQLMTGGRTMIRAGWLETDDGKIRRMDFLGHQKRDVTEAGKRTLGNVIRVRVSSEIPFAPITTVPFGLVSSLHYRYTPRSTPSDPYDPTPQPEDVLDVYPPE